MKLKNLAIILSCFMMLFASCEKEEDIEPIIEETLDNAYIQSVTLINIPPYYWDNASSPDLQLKFAKETNDNWTYVTNRVDNVETVPEELYFEQETKVTTENWELELIDYDDLNSNDVIYRITFNPNDEFEAGKIPVYNNGLKVLEFNYIKK